MLSESLGRYEHGGHRLQQRHLDRTAIAVWQCAPVRVRRAGILRQTNSFGKRLRQVDKVSTPVEQPDPTGSAGLPDQAATALTGSAAPQPWPEQAYVVGQDTSPTPFYLPAMPPPGRDRLGRAARIGIAAALFMSCLALLISALTLAEAWRVRNAAAAGLDDVIAQLDTVCGASAQPVVFPISQTIHFESDIVLPNNLMIPFKGNIPINTTIQVNVPGLPGVPLLKIPINTTVPVDTRVPIPGNISIPVALDVPINQRIPVDLCAGESPTRAILERTIRNIRTARASLNFP